MCRHECCSSDNTEVFESSHQQFMPVVPWTPRLFMSATAAVLSPGSEAMAPRSNIRRNVIPKNLERFTEGPLPKQPDVERLSDRVICILGQNPSSFTLNGTNIYLIGTGKRRVLLDAGEGSPKAELVLALLERVFHAENVEGLDEIIITHLHHDHVGAALEISRRFGPCRISKYPTAQVEVDRRREVIRIEQEKSGIAPESGIIPKTATITWIGLDFELNSKYHKLVDGEVIRTQGATLRILWTPGHASDHVVVLLEEEHSLFSGDLILGYGTSWVDDLSSYMASLRKLETLAPARLYPGHGPCVQNGTQYVTRYIQHREAREKQVLDTINALAPLTSVSAKGGMTSKDLTAVLYPDTPKTLFDRAEGNILKILVKLRGDDLVVSFDPDVRRLSTLDEAATEFAEKQKGSDGRSDPKVAVEEYEKIWYSRHSSASL